MAEVLTGAEEQKQRWFTIVQEEFPATAGYALEPHQDLITVSRYGADVGLTWYDAGPKHFTQNRATARRFTAAEDRFEKQYGR